MANDPAAPVDLDGQTMVRAPSAVKPRAATFKEGDRVRHYEILGLIGKGGMGSVHLARDTKLGRKVAIKFLNTQQVELARRFVVEARATARCSHENIVIIFDADEFHGMPYMVLEFLQGKPLNKLVPKDPMPPGRVVELIVPVVRALQYAHGQGIVHRDLKFDNIFVTDSGTIKVLDFGIAKLLHGEAEEPPAAAAAEADGPAEPGADDELSGLTRSGTIMGTVQFMSPEQWGNGTPVDHRTDLWAVGIMLFRMLAGRHPLHPLAGMALSVTADVSKPLPSLRSVAPGVPAELCDVVDGCLQKKRDARIPDAQALLRGLEPFHPSNLSRSFGVDVSQAGSPLAASPGTSAGLSRAGATGTSRIGEYEVVKRIGTGATGDVYEGLQPALGKRVAIKVLKSTGAPAAVVQHPHIVEVYAVGKLPNGQDYLVMELLAGLPLAKILRDRPRLETEECLPLLEEMFDALAAIHGAGAIHRDLKLANIFVVKPSHGDPFVKLLDLGRAQEGENLAGALPFLAPELLRGEPASPASDLFAAGVIAYKMLTGAMPFDGPTPEALLALHVKGARQISTLAPSCPLRVAALVSSLLKTDPAQRPTAVQAFGEVRTLQRQLQPATQPESAPAPAPVATPKTGLFGKVLSPFRKPAPETAAVAPTRTPAAPPLKERAADSQSLDLLSLSDFSPAEHAPEVEYTAGLEQVVMERALDLLESDSKLPAFPWIAARVVDLTGNDEVGAGELVKLINQDPALTAQVLRAANSAAVSRGVEVMSARDAVTRLGFREVANVALAASTEGLFIGQGSDTFAAERQPLFIHALASAFTATWLAMECRADAQRAFLGGMLHDIGKMVALKALETLLADGAVPPEEVAASLRPLLEAIHADLGSRMCESWKLPAYVARVCAEHHAPSAKADREIHIIRAAAGLTEIGIDPHWVAGRVQEVRESAAVLGLDRFKVRTAVVQVREFAAKACRLANS